MKGRVLVIAGSDSGGGAGIQADIKTISAFSCYSATAITAITVQNTMAVFDILDLPDNIIRAQIRAVLDDIGADVIKTGMLHKSSIIEIIAEEIGDIPFILDPVMVAKGGEELLEKEALKMLKEKLIIKARLITPNIPEAEILSGIKIKDKDGMIKAAEIIRSLGAENILIKGGHLESDEIFDILLTDNLYIFSGKRIGSKNTHGTGCTLASAIAAQIAQNINIEIAVEKARDFVRRAIIEAPNLGKGHGPLNHSLNCFT